MAIEAGKLRKRVQIQALPATQAVDARWNEPTYGDWTTLATWWAGIEPLSGRELVFAAQVVADATHSVTIRWYRGLTPRMRFRYVDDATGTVRIFNIVYVKDRDENHAEQMCLCQEAVP